MITLTDNAIKKVRALMEKENKVGHYLRVGVQGGGCSGFSYVMDFVNEIKEDDTTYKFDGLIVICDSKSIKLLDDIELDFDTNLLSGGFRFNNPKARKSCSCGESFSI